MLDTQNIFVAPYSPQDLHSLRELHALSFRTLASGVHSAEQIYAHLRYMNTDHYADDVARSHVMCAFDADARMIATAGWLFMDGAPTTARIRKVFVHPDHAGTGLGRHMVERAEKAASHHGCADFFVRANINAKGFYKRLGYQDVKPGVMPVDGGVSLPVMFMHKG